MMIRIIITIMILLIIIFTIIIIGTYSSSKKKTQVLFFEMGNSRLLGCLLYFPSIVINHCYMYQDQAVYM